MTQVRSFFALIAIVVLTGTAVPAANAQRYVAKPSPLADSLAQLSDSVSLYSTKPIWVDTATQYSLENQPRFYWDSTRALLRGVKMTQAQMTVLDKLEKRNYEALWWYGSRQSENLPTEASRHRYSKIQELLQLRDIRDIREILTSEQRVTFDERVKARDE